MSNKFKRTIENFTCGHCKAKVKGNGYTNHCPKCLWSKHVDINPGDRAEACGGMMEPINLTMEKDKYIIFHLCQKCKTIKRNQAADNDSVDELIKLSHTIAKKAMF